MDKKIVLVNTEVIPIENQENQNNQPVAMHFKINGLNVDEAEIEINKYMKSYLKRNPDQKQCRQNVQITYGGEMRGSGNDEIFTYDDVKNSHGWSSIAHSRLFRYDEEYECPENFKYYENNITHAIVYLLHKSYVGGIDKYNDCLFKAIEFGVGDRKKLPLSIRSPILLKKFLGIDRLAKISAEYIPKIENEMKEYYINVSGNFTYNSKFQDRKYGLNINLKNGHYTLEKPKNKFFCNFTFHAKPKHCVFSYEINNNEAIIYNGKVQTITTEALNKMLRNRKYIMLLHNKNKTLEKTRDEFIKNADELKEITNEYVNLYKYRYPNEKFKDMLKKLSNNMTEPDSIRQLEGNYINHCYTGGLTYAKKGYSGCGVCYDANSWYPNCIINKNFNFPIREGKFIYISDKEFQNLKYFKYGIYHCNIQNPNNENVSKQFKFMNNNYYTHYDLTRAKELNLKMNIIEDNESNFLYYDKECLVKGHKLFSKYINYFYELKKNGLKGAKEFLNSFIGGLSQKRRHTEYIRDNQKFKCNDTDKIDTITRQKKLWIFKTNNKIEMYASNYARSGCFVNSYARLKMSRIIEPYVNELVRIHTDGFILTKKATNLTIGEEMGEFKIEKEGNVNIIHVNKYTFN